MSEEEFEIISLEAWREEQLAEEEELNDEVESDWTRDPQ